MFLQLINFFWFSALSRVYARKVGSDKAKSCNKSCIMSIIEQMTTSLQQTGVIVFVHKSRASPNEGSHR